MNIDEHHVALPKLYGAPAYGRPPRPVGSTDRPVDLDDLPLEAFRTDEDLALLGSSGPTPPDGRSNGSGPGGGGGGIAERERGPSPRLEPRPFSLRSLSRFLSGDR